MKVIYVVILAAGAALVGQVHAQVAAEETLAKAKNCFACHTVDKKVVGPAYKDVAAKYKNDPKAAVTLAAKIKAGGKGIWGPVPMPPNQVTEDEAKKLAVWVLSRK